MCIKTRSNWEIIQKHLNKPACRLVSLIVLQDQCGNVSFLSAATSIRRQQKSLKNAVIAENVILTQSSFWHGWQSKTILWGDTLKYTRGYSARILINASIIRPNPKCSHKHTKSLRTQAAALDYQLKLFTCVVSFQHNSLANSVKIQWCNYCAALWSEWIESPCEWQICLSKVKFQSSSVSVNMKQRDRRQQSWTVVKAVPNSPLQPSQISRGSVTVHLLRMQWSCLFTIIMLEP